MWGFILLLFMITVSQHQRFSDRTEASQIIFRDEQLFLLHSPVFTTFDNELMFLFICLFATLCNKVLDGFHPNFEAWGIGQRRNHSTFRADAGIFIQRLLILVEAFALLSVILLNSFINFEAYPSVIR